MDAIWWRKELEEVLGCPMWSEEPCLPIQVRVHLPYDTHGLTVSDVVIRGDKLKRWFSDLSIWAQDDLDDLELTNVCLRSALGELAPIVGRVLQTGSETLGRYGWQKEGEGLWFHRQSKLPEFLFYDLTMFHPNSSPFATAPSRWYYTAESAWRNLIKAIFNRIDTKIYSTW